MNSTDKLRQIAQDLRKTAEAIENKKTEKLANIVLASTALELLRRKLQ
jgi:hypothetical protein